MVAVIVATFALAACGGGGGNVTSTAKPTSTAVTPESLAPALLAAKDFPPTWTEIAITSEGGTLCGVQPLKAKGTVRARVAFAATDATRQVVQHGVTVYPKGAAAAIVAKFRATLRGCTQTVIGGVDRTGGGAATQRLRVAPLRLPAVGDERLGLRLTPRDRSSAILYGVIRRGDRVFAIALSGQRVDAKLFSDLVGTADRRLVALAAG